MGRLSWLRYLNIDHQIVCTNYLPVEWHDIVRFPHGACEVVRNGYRLEGKKLNMKYVLEWDDLSWFICSDLHMRKCGAGSFVFYHLKMCGSNPDFINKSLLVLMILYILS